MHSLLHFFSRDVSVSEIIATGDMHAYTRLTDNILYLILNSPDGKFMKVHVYNYYEELCGMLDIGKIYNSTVKFIAL